MHAEILSERVLFGPASLFHDWEAPREALGHLKVAQAACGGTQKGGLIQRCSVKRDPRVVGRHFSAFQEALSFIPVIFSEHLEEHGRPGTPTSFC